MRGKAGDAITPVELETLRSRTFYGREKDNAVYPIALANLVLHGIDEPHIWHGNALSGIATYDGLFAGAPQFFDYVLMNPPFGGKEGKEAQTQYDYKTGATPTRGDSERSWTVRSPRGYNKHWTKLARFARLPRNDSPKRSPWKTT